MFFILNSFLHSILEKLKSVFLDKLRILDLIISHSFRYRGHVMYG